MTIWNTLKHKVRANDALYRPIAEAHRWKRWSRAFLQSAQRRRDLSNYLLRSDDYILCHWSVSRNFGDALSPIVTEAISRKIPLVLSTMPAIYPWVNYAVIGSVLQFPANSHTEIWGSGFIDAAKRFPVKPKKVHAVRGPLTRSFILEQGIACPPVYGDPAVFAFDPLIATDSTKSYKVGIIPHYHDATHPAILQLEKRDDVRLIDVHDDFRTIARQAQECHAIVSSSLHGLILADALKIPNRWLGVSKAVMHDGFKFQDYFISVQRNEPTPLCIDDLTVEQVTKEAHLRHVPFDREQLLAECPFRSHAISSSLDIKI